MGYSMSILFKLWAMFTSGYGVHINTNIISYKVRRIYIVTSLVFVHDNIAMCIYNSKSPYFLRRIRGPKTSFAYTFLQIKMLLTASG